LYPNPYAPLLGRENRQRQGLTSGGDLLSLVAEADDASKQPAVSAGSARLRGWDTFTLDYRAPWPVSLVLSRRSLTKYQVNKSASLGPARPPREGVCLGRRRARAQPGTPAPSVCRPAPKPSVTISTCAMRWPWTDVCGCRSCCSGTCSTASTWSASWRVCGRTTRRARAPSAPRGVRCSARTASASA
jgi:hypothetical protein